MRGSRQALALTGAGLMALGGLATWVQYSPAELYLHGTVLGPAVALPAAGLVVLLQLAEDGRGAPLVGALSAAWIALASEAAVAWGAYLALLGALLVTATAAWPPRPAGAPARRIALPLVCAVIACGVVSVMWTSLGAESSSKLNARDDFRFQSSDGRARGVGTIEWRHGASHEGRFRPGSVVEAVGPVACLWVKVEWGFVLGAARTPGGYVVKCREPGTRKPDPLSLVGLSYANARLRSATIELCVSGGRDRPPRSCAWQRLTYSLL